eukprot:gb/GEZJ01000384.1/.p1 GENE.gb/GEZJ01000384.1/~~gb/GEZJ01000384.1/.p1  ORF type:complete len:792 (-),score=58.67 gb/GEZJ01000384.1/:477-2852(-)
MQSDDHLVLTALEVFCPSPSPFSLPSGPVSFPHGIRTFAAGFNFALLIDHYYRVHSWGFNSEFQRLGRSLANDHVEVEPTYVPINTNSAIVDCASGANHSIVLTLDGQVYSFGADDYGQLGRLNSDPLPAPVSIPARIAQVHCGWNFCVALTHDRRSLFTWGSGKEGQLAHGYFPERSQPTKVSLQGSALCVATGHSHTVVLLETESNTRQVLTWGADGLASYRQDLPRKIPRLPETNVICVSAGKQFSIFLTEEGIVYAAGHGDEGQLGVDDTHGRNNACMIPSLLGHHIVNISASNTFAIALSGEGSFFVWGSGILKPRRLRDEIFSFSSSFPKSFAIRMEGFGSTTMIAAPSTFPTNSALRPFRAFLKSFCEGQVLDGLRQTRVHYSCLCPERTIRYCSHCFTRAYGPLLGTASNLIRSRLEIHRYLDWSTYEKDCVVRTLKLLCSGVVDEDASLETLQEMAELLRRHESYAFERIISDILRSRLLQRVTQNRDYWDVYDVNPEQLDERRVRVILGRIQDSDTVRLQFKYIDIDESTLEFRLDPLLLSVQSSSFSEFLQSHIHRDANAVLTQWEVPIWGDKLCPEAAHVLEEWFRGSALSIPGDEDHNMAVAVYTDLIRVSMCLKMNVLLLVAEQHLVKHTNPSISFNNWWKALLVSERTGSKHAYHKLLSLADSICANIKLRQATVRVQKLEKSSSAMDLLFDQIPSEERALSTFRRSRIYCDGFMSINEAAKNLQEACNTDGYQIGEGNIRLDGHSWRTAEDEEGLPTRVGELSLEERRRHRCTVA